tara:strand:- start:88 stop:1212 length:1125 start_codon:yes stop_codon:yes gene_type:complete
MNKNISVIGVGKLGLCFALTLEEVGYNVIGLDINQEYVDILNSKMLTTNEPGVVEKLNKSVNFEATTDLQSTINHSDVLFVVVATPSLANGRYDHTQVDELCVKLKELGRQDTQKHLVLCCTVMPGYTDIITERLDDLNYTVSYNPEFIAQGTILRDQSRPDMVLIGEGSKEAGDIIQKIYERHTSNNPRICRMNPVEAEITKISLNCFLTTKIAFTNMVGDIVINSGGNPDVVLDAIGSDTRVNHKYLKYGFGYGGPCFPRDNRALSIYAGDIGCPAEISKATDKSNELHLDEQVKIFQRENTNKENRIEIDGVTYKKGSDILEESQQLKFAIALSDIGYDVWIKETSSVIETLKTLYPKKFNYIHSDVEVTV